MRIALLALLALPTLAADGVQPYRWSVAAVVAANALDYHSTTVALRRPGLREGNPLMARPDGSLHHSRAAWAKTGVIMGNILLQHWLVDSPRTRRAATWINFSVAIGLTIVTGYNYQAKGVQSR